MIKRNIVANFAGSAWIGLMGLMFVPVYLRYIGVEGYGLIGFFTLISSMLVVLDGGFAAAAARELARCFDSPSEVQSVCDLVRTLEWIFWFIAFLLGITLLIAAPVIVSGWLHVQHISTLAATRSLRLMGLALILQWPIAYYNGCIVGLQRQVELNIINSINATVRSGGAVLVLALIAPTIEAFFTWQVIATFINVGSLRHYLWISMPGDGTRPKFQLKTLRSVGNFALSVGGINILALLLTQLDKIILSKILPLDKFGYYTLAATLAALSYRLIGPVFNAFYPRITQLVGRADLDSTKIFRQACQVMALGIIPFSLLLVFFGRDIVWVWTGNAPLASNIAGVVACLVVGTLCNGLMTIPYALQLAHGWTSFALRQNLVAALALAPLTYFLAIRYGVQGAALVWPLVNICYIFIGAPIVFRKLLPSEFKYWSLSSMAMPILSVAAFMGLAKLTISTLTPGLSRPMSVVIIGCVYLASMPLCAWSMSAMRNELKQYLTSKRQKSVLAS